MLQVNEMLRAENTWGNTVITGAVVHGTKEAFEAVLAACWNTLTNDEV